VSAAPVFAVVGHPNKGKSTLVATLAQDTSVRIGREPGITTIAREFPMRIDSGVLYVLVDTPGFQRPRAVLEWLQAQNPNAADRPQAVTDFVEQHGDDPRFAAECELLLPIINGAGILYVVDGAVPYAPEYDAEMEILRWSGQPSIALINPIGSRAHVDDWSRALGQYFRVVRMLDALDAPFEQRLQVLSAFGELSQHWREPMSRAVNVLRRTREQALHDSANAIAELIAEAITWQVERQLGADDDAQAHQTQLEQRYQQGLRELEGRCRQRVEACYQHEHIERKEATLEAIDEDLFSQDTWLLFGLQRKDLARAGIAGGALTGLGVDVLSGGGSMFLGAALGAAIGGVSSWFSVDALAELKVKRLPMGGRIARFGPSRNDNLPYVLLGRARAHQQLVSGRSHAQREPLELRTQGALNVLTNEQRDGLARACATLRKQVTGGTRARSATIALSDTVAAILQHEDC
jgi:hypothetical protein